MEHKDANDPSGESDEETEQPPRRRMLLSAAGFMLLAITTTNSITRRGSTAMSNAGGSHPQALDPAPGLDDPSLPDGSDPSGTSPTDKPQSRLASAPRYYVDDSAGPTAIALTLDDGPHPIYTLQILEILDRYDIKATFNMIGKQVRGNLALVREVSAAGHTITNHTWDHADMRKYSAARIVSEIDACNDALADANQQPTIFRAPYGYWTPAVFAACATRSLTPLGWSVDPQDWDTAHVSTQDIVNTVLRTTHEHDIILEHDGGGDRSNTVAALQIFLPELLDRGFVFTAV
ncbi:polysaccharide deacetylase family protein [Actinospica robiniae]|uniref:polysaccharide deacetylase family protein n=1 Tax=Actinospica robiniae TaxID=304901 RepID=UPI00040E3C58|nr:polysaccharide deacetylase family protein [Actinospica robiniae]